MVYYLEVLQKREGLHQSKSQKLFFSRKFDFTEFFFFSLPDFVKTQRRPSPTPIQNKKNVIPITQTVIEGDRANYDSYDYNDYDLYAYDEDEDEKLREEYKLKQELSEILDKLNMTTTESPLPNAVRILYSVASIY